MARKDASIPDWPAMMQRATAARYCDMTPEEFEREVVAMRLPVPTRFGAQDRWSRRAIDESLERLNGGGVPDWRAGSPLHAQR